MHQNFNSYRSPQVGYASPTFSDASTTVSPRDVFGDDHIMKKTYPSLFGRGESKPNGGERMSTAAASGSATMDPARDHLSSHHPHAPLRDAHKPHQVFHSPLAVDSNTSSPRAIFAPLHTLRSTDSYLSTSSEEEDEVPSPIILPEPQPRPSTSAPHSSMHYFAGVPQQASPAWSEGAGLGRELNKVDLGFKPLTGVDRFRNEETGKGNAPLAPSRRGDDYVDDEGDFRPQSGPGMGKSVIKESVTFPEDADDASTEDGTYSQSGGDRTLLDSRQVNNDDDDGRPEVVDMDFDEGDIPTSSSDSDADDAPYTSKGRPGFSAAAARRAALATANRGGAARRGRGLGRPVGGVGKPRSKPKGIVGRGISKVRGGSTSASSSGRASPASGEITYCPFSTYPSICRFPSTDQRLTLALCLFPLAVNPTSKKQCSASFVRFYDLKRHEETVHGLAAASALGGAQASSASNGFWCEKCNKPFSRKDALIRHQKTIPDCWKNKGKPGKSRK